MGLKYENSTNIWTPHEMVPKYGTQNMVTQALLLTESNVRMIQILKEDIDNSDT